MPIQGWLAPRLESTDVFLASPAAGFITGTNLLVDGALTAGVQY